MATVGGLGLHLDVGDVIEDASGVVRRAVVGDDERDAYGEW
jgi:hypothetical protein